MAGELLAAAMLADLGAQPAFSSMPASEAVSAPRPARLSLLGELLAFPPERQPLDEDELREGLQCLASAVGQAEEDGSNAVSTVAAAALTTVASKLEKPWLMPSG